MPLDKIVLIVLVVLVGIGMTVWVSALALSALAVPFAWLALLPAALVGYILWRVISERLTNSEDDHYDRIEK
jgi:membrane protein implicated in regulation of membrane protease activity